MLSAAASKPRGELNRSTAPLYGICFRGGPVQRLEDVRESGGKLAATERRGRIG